MAAVARRSTWATGDYGGMLPGPSFFRKMRFFALRQTITSCSCRFIRGARAVSKKCHVYLTMAGILFGKTLYANLEGTQAHPVLNRSSRAERDLIRQSGSARTVTRPHRLYTSGGRCCQLRSSSETKPLRVPWAQLHNGRRQSAFLLTCPIKGIVLLVLDTTS